MSVGNFGKCKGASLSDMIHALRRKDFISDKIVYHYLFEPLRPFKFLRVLRE
jgi:hypothetical protein